MALEKPGNYTLGRGRIFLARSDVGGPANGFRYVGNTPAFDMTVESETLDHFGSDEGVNVLDASVTTQVTRNGTYTMDDVQPENLALFVRGTAAAIVQAATGVGAGPLYTFEDGVEEGIFYQIGQMDALPHGVTYLADAKAVTDSIANTPATAAVAADGVVTMTGGTAVADFEVTLEMGLIRFKAAVAETVRVGYSLAAAVNSEDDPRTRVLSGFGAIRGSLMFLENNPSGRNRRFLFPNVEIAANGAAALKGDEWRQMPMSYNILAPAHGAAVIIDSIPAGAKLNVAAL